MRDPLLVHFVCYILNTQMYILMSSCSIRFESTSPNARSLKIVREPLYILKFDFDYSIVFSIVTMVDSIQFD